MIRRILPRLYWKIRSLFHKPNPGPVLTLTQASQIFKESYDKAFKELESLYGPNRKSTLFETLRNGHDKG